MIKNLIEIKFCLCCSDCKTKWRQPLCSWFPSTPDHEPIPRCPTGLSRAKTNKQTNNSASLFSRLSLSSFKQILHSYHRNGINQVKSKFVEFLDILGPVALRWRKEFENENFTLKTHQMFSVHTYAEEI